MSASGLHGSVCTAPILRGRCCSRSHKTLFLHVLGFLLQWELASSSTFSFVPRPQWVFVPRRPASPDAERGIELGGKLYEEVWHAQTCCPIVYFADLDALIRERFLAALSRRAGSAVEWCFQGGCCCAGECFRPFQAVARRTDEPRDRGTQPGSSTGTRTSTSTSCPPIHQLLRIDEEENSSSSASMPASTRKNGGSGVDHSSFLRRLLPSPLLSGQREPLALKQSAGEERDEQVAPGGLSLTRFAGRDHDVDAMEVDASPQMAGSHEERAAQSWTWAPLEQIGTRTRTFPSVQMQEESRACAATSLDRSTLSTRSVSGRPTPSTRLIRALVPVCTSGRAVLAGGADIPLPATAEATTLAHVSGTNAGVSPEVVVDEGKGVGLFGSDEHLLVMRDRETAPGSHRSETGNGRTNRQQEAHAQATDARLHEEDAATSCSSRSSCPAARPHPLALDASRSSDVSLFSRGSSWPFARGVAATLGATTTSSASAARSKIAENASPRPDVEMTEGAGQGAAAVRNGSGALLLTRTQERQAGECDLLAPRSCNASATAPPVPAAEEQDQNEYHTCRSRTSVFVPPDNGGLTDNNDREDGCSQETTETSAALLERSGSSEERSRKSGIFYVPGSMRGVVNKLSLSGRSSPSGRSILPQTTKFLSPSVSERFSSVIGGSRRSAGSSASAASASSASSHVTEPSHSFVSGSGEGAFVASREVHEEEDGSHGRVGGGHFCALPPCLSPTHSAGSGTCAWAAPCAPLSAGSVVGGEEMIELTHSSRTTTSSPRRAPLPPKPAVPKAGVKIGADCFHRPPPVTGVSITSGSSFQSISSSSWGLSRGREYSCPDGGPIEETRRQGTDGLLESQHSGAELSRSGLHQQSSLPRHG